ncbi:MULTISPECIES: NADH-quinone oxidoreductase subunit L [unclassified Pseudoalteromonas]|uniref:NADH-quinone oxidoreductase subunit L n=1 Tax=unclassified Pseudoalteromonas TaxID=194690 RepID=UPI0015FFA2AA|nr:MULTISPECIES: NADH-quinone oxidoreductase subunit L [unclassified Pseudoalteromonas]MBB1291593.1 NADH-quinone oxidoreductase subunit L [Pseudoalteromonas sp. SR41-4]MBB1303352.1 NADH-quinone oxidoreductase subunit L [Pseudoalteromonas sp. SR44-8]MBB1398528.1 NADH-quinone oxidoreductase subunit L [Pseudoalteromonas sp. SG44-8]
MSELIISLLMLAIPLSMLLTAYIIGNKTTANNGKAIFYVLIANALLLIGALTAQTTFSLSLISALSFTTTRIIMLALIVFIGICLVRFCQNYMAGEPRINYFWRWLLTTLSAVTLVVLSNHLILFWLGWLSISLALHKLLMFYPNRPRAALAAHKKFIVARLAETCLFIAFALLYNVHDTWLITEITAAYINNTVELTLSEQLAGSLIALAALIKCAQLPLHGWLIQVVEAPTPVSALLHAGVINLGGFLLILFAPLFMQATIAQWLVLVVAGLTTVISALVMTTRVSVKVRLAWSTSAQMGLMLLECALGLFELALMHLVTHSMYKAYAFLNAGNAINEDINRRHAPKHTPSLADWLRGMIISTVIVSSAWFISGYSGAISVWLLLTLALTILIATKHGIAGRSMLIPITFIALIATLSYVGLKTLFGLAVDTTAWREAAFSIADIWAIVLITTLMALSYFLRNQSQHPKVKALSTMLFAGLYLDEWFTRLTLKLWPIRLPVDKQTNTKHHNQTFIAKESQL